MNIRNGAIAIALALIAAAIIQATALTSTAYASGLQAGSQAVSAQANTVKIDVVDSITNVSGNSKQKITLSYLDNGLIEKSVTKDQGAYGLTRTAKYNYSKDKLTKVTQSYENDSTKSSVNIKYDSKGRTKAIRNRNGMDNNFKHDSKNRITATESVYNSSNYTVKYAYNDIGQVTRTTHTYNGELGRTESYTYNAKGDVAKRAVDMTSNKISIAYKYTYKDGNIAKRVNKQNNGASTSVSFTYKTVNVPKSYAAAVKYQQAGITGAQSLVFANSYNVYLTQA